MVEKNIDAIEIKAYAKINLFLHVTEKSQDNYHLLQSLVSFTDLHDIIKISSHEKFVFQLKAETENISTDDNLVISAAKKLSDFLSIPLNLSITLDKRIPIGAGLGGGSADAAATIKGLLKFWNKKIPNSDLNEILLSLGADVPACFFNEPCIIEGIGEVITPLSFFPKIHALLIYPNEFCSTSEIFRNYDKEFSNKIIIPKNFPNQDLLYSFLKQQKNDLRDAACKKIPAIIDILNTLEKQKGCPISRMSGSGSACFGLFNTKENCEKAARAIQKERPEWWVWPTILGKK